MRGGCREVRTNFYIAWIGDFSNRMWYGPNAEAECLAAARYGGQGGTQPPGGGSGTPGGGSGTPGGGSGTPGGGSGTPGGGGGWTPPGIAPPSGQPHEPPPIPGWYGFCDHDSARAFQFAGNLIRVLKLLIPLIIIILGSIDLGKAVVANDTDEIKKSGQTLIKRFIAGIIIFFIPGIIAFILSLIDNYDENVNPIVRCGICVTRPNDCEIPPRPEERERVAMRSANRLRPVGGRAPTRTDPGDGFGIGGGGGGGIIIGSGPVRHVNWAALQSARTNLSQPIPRPGNEWAGWPASEASFFRIYDINSGRCFRAFRGSGGEHMDVVPASWRDTEIFSSIVGSWSWDRRPIIVMYNGNLWAASMHSMPHGEGVRAVGFNRNGHPGHFCIHFLNSRGHGSRAINAEHQAAVLTAYRRGNELGTIRCRDE